MSDKIWDEVAARHAASLNKAKAEQSSDAAEDQKDLDYAADAGISDKKAKEISRKKQTERKIKRDLGYE